MAASARRPRFPATDQLFARSEAFAHGPESDALFDQAMAECAAWHRQRCPTYAAFLAAKGLDPARPPARPEDLPPLLVTVFKHFRLVSIPDVEIALELTSSGTGGQRSAIVLDRTSLRRILALVRQIFGSLGLVAVDEAVDYLCFTYDPRRAKNVGTAFSDKVLTGLTRRHSVFYAIKWNEQKGDFAFDLAATVRRLLAFARRGGPVRILGFPAYLWEVCDQLEQRGERLQLGPRSFVLTGGGWKLAAGREVSKEIFRERVARVLGLPAANIRDMFGLVEHGIPYVDCEHGRLHVPIYARARVVEPGNLCPLPYGSEGLLQLMTPYLTSYPSISLLTTDRARLDLGCPCGRPGPTLSILGRAGLAKHKGCAINALELLARPAAGTAPAPAPAPTAAPTAAPTTAPTATPAPPDGDSQ